MFKKLYSENLKGLLERPKCIIEGDSKVDLKDVTCNGMDWIQLNGIRPLIGSCEHSNEASGCTE